MKRFWSVQEGKVGFWNLQTNFHRGSEKIRVAQKKILFWRPPDEDKPTQHKQTALFK
jgi:hypothetical protein